MQVFVRILEEWGDFPGVSTFFTGSFGSPDQDHTGGSGHERLKLVGDVYVAENPKAVRQ
jgi:hypothetical protein